MKKPIIPIAVLFMAIFLMDLNRRGYLRWPSEKTIATSCRSVLVMLEKRVPKNWDISCDKNQLTVIVEQEFKNKDLEASDQLLKQAMYRELANHLIFVSKNSLNESLERTDYVILKLKHKEKQINALAFGKDVSKLATMNKPELIAEHLKNTVKVQEN